MSIAALTLALLAGAPPPWLEAPFTADPAALVAAAAALPPPAGTELDLLREESDLTFDEAGRSVRRYRLVYRPRTKAAAEAWSRLSMTYTPGNEQKPEVRARVVSPSGQARWLDPASVVDGVLDQTGAQLYSDERVLQAPLPGIEAGAVVEEEIVVREHAPFFAAGFATRLGAYRPIPVRSLRLRVEAPAALPLRVKAWGLPAPREERQGGRLTATLEVEDLPARPKAEPWLPPDAARPRHLAVSTGRSWGAVAAAYAERAERQLAGADLAAAAREIVAPSDPPAVAAQKVLDWIGARVRYTGLALGESGLIPARPAETLERGYGDCKDLSLLAVGLLRASGRAAQLALVRTAGDELDPEAVGLGQFDHAVVRLEARPPVWLDPAGGSLAGQLGPSAQGRLALLVDRSSTGLTRTAEGAPADNRVVQHRRIELAASGWSRASEELRLTGLPAVEHRRAAGQGAGDGEALARSRLVAVDGAKVARTTSPGAGAEAAVVRSEASASRWGTTGDDDAEAVVAPHAAFQVLPEPFRTDPLAQGDDAAPPKPREAPLRLAYARSHELRYEVVPPPGFRPGALPDVEGFTVGPARFEAEAAAGAGGAVVVTYRLELGRTLTPAEADRLWREVAERTKVDGPRIRFERTSQVLLREGKGQEALGELRRLVALQPSAAGPRNRLALALLTLGMGEAARAEAGRAVAAAPESEWAQRVHGFTLAHDLAGRQYAPGADLAGAEAAYRKAKALAPKSPTPRGLLAEVIVRRATLEPSAAGRAARLEEALSELRVVREELGSHAFDDEYLGALFSTGRADEALAAARAMPAGPKRNAILVASTMGLGMERFGQETGQLPERDRGPAGQAAFLELMRTRQYGVLSKFFAELRARGALDGAQGLEQFEKLRRHETVALERGDPASLPTLLFKALAAPDLVAAFKPLFRKGERIVPEETRELRRSMAAMIGKDVDGLSIDVFVDLLVGLMKVKVVGDGPPWRLLVEASVDEKKPAGTMELVAIQEDGLPRLLALQPSRGDLGRFAWRLAAAGDAAAARRVLGWALDGLPAAKPGAPSLEGVVAALWPGDAAGPEDVRRTAAAVAAFAQGPAPERPDLGLDGLRREATGAARAALTYAALVDTPPADAARALALADELLAEAPGAARAAWWRRFHALRRLGRIDEARRAAEERLAADPSDLEPLRLLCELAFRARDPKALAAARARLLADPKATADDWNEAAWSRLFLEDPPPPAALEEARQAVNLSRGRHYGRLHTLATVEAWSGRPPGEAMATLRRVFQAGEGDIGGADWLVLGRIAEAYGLPEEAAASYRRVPPSRPEALMDSGELAARRLEALGAKAAAPATP